MMKTISKILGIIALQFITTVTSVASIPSLENDGRSIPLQRNPVIHNQPGPSRSPEHLSLSLVVQYFPETSKLEFYDNVSENVSFQVYDEEGTMVLGETCAFNVDGYYSASVMGLDFGTYTLKVFINGVEYQGTFEVK